MIGKSSFLDRNGAINIDNGYIYRIEDFKFCDGIFEALNGFSKLGYIILVITNQSGIACGYYNEDDFALLTQYMVDKFLNFNMEIRKVYYCLHLGDECGCRKPKPGMIFKAKEEFDINLEESILIGDKDTDIQAGQRAGLKSCFLLSQDNGFTSVLDVYNKAKEYL
ncbi:D-glycero-alpha-D-manno-heptose-1,7-bisphosphate 7-phosphatase [Campylobacter concisus]|uniref:D-glycero-alpha-D-manno-heptose-1,7-bisphosphate 7-phosphatase n=1 Tax=Campylobacter concisus TaxID=199 RepID=UPI000CD84A81|nr:HAD family hydrolase [Campylobacter concisus]